MRLQQMTLRAARVNAGYGQKKAAELLGITNKTLSSWENGRSYPTVNMVQKICSLYRVDYDDIIFLPHETLKAN